MRVLLDTNILISYLLNPDSDGTIQTILHTFLGDQFTLLLPEMLMEELSVTVTKRHDLYKKLPPDHLQTFLGCVAKFF